MATDERISEDEVAAPAASVVKTSGRSSIGRTAVGVVAATGHNSRAK